MIICTKLWRDDDDDVSDGLLQVWYVIGPTHFESAFSLDFEIPRNSLIFLAPNGLTVVISNHGSYSWNHDTAQFDPFHFTSQEHFYGPSLVYSPDGELVACRSLKDNHIQVWDTWTGQLCGNPIIRPDVKFIALSPALNDQFLGKQLIAMSF